MATRKKYDLAVKVGEYTDRDRNKKSRYQNVGAIMEKDDGGKFLMLARWFNPSGVPDFSGKGGESILISMFEPKENGSGGGSGNGGVSAKQSAPTSTPEPQDDIPF